MNDQAAKQFAGHAGACAVLVDMLIDKGIVSQSEILDRFRRARSAATHWSGGRATARELAEILAYLDSDADEASAASLEGTALAGETVLLVESDIAVGERLQAALEGSGAEVLLARSAAEALPRIAQFDFSSAMVEWRPDTREHRALIRWLREDGVRFLYRAERLPDDTAMSRGLPVLLKSAPARDVVAALARLTGSGAESSAGVA